MVDVLLFCDFICIATFNVRSDLLYQHEWESVLVMECDLTVAIILVLNFPC